MGDFSLEEETSNESSLAQRVSLQDADVLLQPDVHNLIPSKP